MTDKELEQKSVDLMNLFLSFCDDSEVEWEGEKARLWTPWTK